VHVLVEAGRRVDDKHASGQGQAVRRSKRKNGLCCLALAQDNGDNCKNNQSEIKEDLQQSLLVQVMVEYSNH